MELLERALFAYLVGQWVEIPIFMIAAFFAGGNHMVKYGKTYQNIP